MKDRRVNNKKARHFVGVASLNALVRYAKEVVKESCDIGSNVACEIQLWHTLGLFMWIRGHVASERCHDLGLPCAHASIAIL